MPGSRVSGPDVAAAGPLVVGKLPGELHDDTLSGGRPVPARLEDQECGFHGLGDERALAFLELGVEGRSVFLQCEVRAAGSGDPITPQAVPLGVERDLSSGALR
jgi:hypothetical protein